MFFVLGDVEKAFGAKTAVDLFDDDRDGVADPDVFTYVQKQVEVTIKATLMSKSFSIEQIELFDGDEMVNMLAVNLCMGLGGDRRPEWIDPVTKRGPHAAKYDWAITQLKKLTTAELHVPAEATVGTNRMPRGNLQGAGTVIAPNRSDPKGPGGY